MTSRWPKCRPDNRPDLLRVAVLVPVLSVVAELKINTVDEALVGRIRLDKQRTQLEPVECETTVPCEAVQRHIETGLKPPGDTVHSGTPLSV